MSEDRVAGRHPGTRVGCRPESARAGLRDVRHAEEDREAQPTGVTVRRGTARLVVHALHTNELPFVNGGEHVTAIPEIPTWLSLAAILVTLLVTTVASPVQGRRTRVAAGADRSGAADGGTTAAVPSGSRAADDRDDDGVLVGAAPGAL